MIKSIVWWWLAAAILFATTHALAVTWSLYWYWSGFDNVMHAAGGGLVVVGLYAFGTLPSIARAPRWYEVLGVLLGVTIVWEVFEWSVGLWDPATYVYETAKDISVGLVSGLLTDRLLRMYN